MQVDAKKLCPAYEDGECRREHAAIGEAYCRTFECDSCKQLQPWCFASRSMRGVMSADLKPNPGSAEARAVGCICPVSDNHQGRGRGGDGAQFGWYARVDCWLHKPLAPVTVELMHDEPNEEPANGS